MKTKGEAAELLEPQIRWVGRQADYKVKKIVLYCRKEYRKGSKKGQADGI